MERLWPTSAIFKPLEGKASGPRVFERPPIFGYDLNVTTRATSFDGGALVTFPKLTRIDTCYVEMDNDVGLTGIVLVSSIVNPIASTWCAMYVAYDSGAVADLAGMSRCFVGTVTGQNSALAGTPNPTNKATAINFGENAAIRVNSRQRLYLYAAGSLNIGQLFAASMTVYTIPLAQGS